MLKAIEQGNRGDLPKAQENNYSELYFIEQVVRKINVLFFSKLKRNLRKVLIYGVEEALMKQTGKELLIEICLSVMYALVPICHFSLPYVTARGGKINTCTL